MKFLSQIILTFFKQTRVFCLWHLLMCWFCCLRHQKSRAFCVIFTLLLAHTDSLWQRCHNISGLGGFFHFHSCHQTSKDFFSSAGCTLNKIQRKKDLRITINSKWQFQHSSLFFQRVLEDSFCLLCVDIPYLLVYNLCTQINCAPHFSRQFSKNILKYHLVEQSHWDRNNHQRIPQC